MIRVTQQVAIALLSLTLSLAPLADAKQRKKRAVTATSEHNASPVQTVVFVGDNGGQAAELVAGDRQRVPVVTIRIGQITVLTASTPIKQINFGDDRCVARKGLAENGSNSESPTLPSAASGTPYSSQIAYLIGNQKCAVQTVWVETASGLAPFDLVVVGTGKFTREVKVAANGEAAEINSLRNRVGGMEAEVSRLTSTVQHAEAAAREAAALVPEARAAGYTAGSQAATQIEREHALSTIAKLPLETKSDGRFVLNTKGVRVRQVGSWTPSESGMWARYQVENRSREFVRVAVETSEAISAHLWISDADKIKPRERRTMVVFIAAQPTTDSTTPLTSVAARIRFTHSPASKENTNARTIESATAQQAR